MAERMRATLVEVLGQERGGGMYDLDWLRDRVRFHLDATRCVGEVFVATREDIVGHLIVRIEPADSGLISTVYVDPSARGSGVANALIQAAEAWFIAHGAGVATTYTHPTNERLHRLFARQGYALEPIDHDFVKLSKPLG